MRPMGPLWRVAHRRLSPAQPERAVRPPSIVTFFTQVLKVQRTDNCPTLTTEIVSVQADDDYVTVLWPRTYLDPRDPADAACAYPTAPGAAAYSRGCTGKHSTTWFDPGVSSTVKPTNIGLRHDRAAARN